MPYTSRGVLEKKGFFKIICPAGWHLPKGADKTNEADNEFWSLIVTGLNGGVNPSAYDGSTYPYYYGAEGEPVSIALRSYPNNFVYSGYVMSGSVLRNRNLGGYYWSASGRNSDYTYSVHFQSSFVYPGTYYYSSLFTGQTVRCIAGV